VKNRVVIIIVAIVAVLAAIYLGQGLISTAVTGQVDTEVARMVEQENASMPKRVDDSIEIERIRHNVDERKLIFTYNLLVDAPTDRYPQLRSQANQRVFKNNDLKRAMSYGYLIIHRFSDPQGKVVLEFETPKE